MATNMKKPKKPKKITTPYGTGASPFFGGQTALPDGTYAQPDPTFFTPFGAGGEPFFTGQTALSDGSYAKPDPTFFSGADVADSEGFLKTLAEEKPLDFYSGQLAKSGELTGAGPPSYESWLQNQHFNTLYADYQGQKSQKPELGWLDYMALEDSPGLYGGEGTNAQARNAYNALTPSQRGSGFNPYSSGTGRWTLWG